MVLSSCLYSSNFDSGASEPIIIDIVSLGSGHMDELLPKKKNTKRKLRLTSIDSHIALLFIQKKKNIRNLQSNFVICDNNGNIDST